jgi:hypothetical protein
MPKVNVNGIGPINFPDSMSEDEIAFAISQFPQNKKFNDRITDKLWMLRDQTERPNPLEKLGRGAQDTLDRLAQLTVAGGEAIGHYGEGTGEALTQELNKEQAEYLKNKGYDTDFDAERLAGGIGMTAPLALLPGGQSAMGAAGYGALGGAAEGFLQYDPTYSLKGTLQNTGAGAVTGGIVAPVMRAVTSAAGQFLQRGMGRFKGAIEAGKTKPDELLKEVPELAQLPVEQRAALILEAQNQIKQTGSLNVEQLARKANLIANDVTPTKSMVTRDPRDWSMERNMQKLAQSPDEQIASMGQELTGVYQGNDAALGNRLRSFSSNLPKATQEAHGGTVMRMLDDLSTSSQKKVSELYKQVRETTGDQLASDAKNLANTLDNLKDNAYSEKLVTSVANKLKRFGMMDKDGALTNQTLTVTQAEELRKFVNALPNDFGKRDIIQAIDADVLQGAGADAFQGARKAAAQRFEMLDNPVTQKALNAYGELSQGKTAQNFIKTQVIDAAEQDVGTLLKTLSQLPKQQADEAADALKAGVLDFLQSKAINPNSGQFSGAKLNDAIRAVGDGKLQQILGKQGYDELKSLARAGTDATYQPPYSAVNHSNTAPMLLSMTQKARAIPGVPLIVNESAEKLAARSGYKKQLGDVLSARVHNTPPNIPPRVQAMIRMIRASGAPVAAASVNQKLNERGQ